MSAEVFFITFGPLTREQSATLLAATKEYGALRVVAVKGGACEHVWAGRSGLSETCTKCGAKQGWLE